MKRIIASLIGLIIILSYFNNLYAFDISDQPVEVSVSETFVSRYIWRGQDLYGDNDAAHQLSIDVFFPKLFKDTDISFNIWGSFPMNSGHEDSEELDYTIAFSRDVFDERFNISAGFTYFDFPNTSGTADVSEPWGSMTLNKIPGLPIDISATVFAGYDFAAKSGGPDEGWYYSWGFDTEIGLPVLSIFQDEQTLVLGVVSWGNDGVADLESSSLYATELSVSTSYALAGFTITPSLNYSIGHEEVINSGNDELWGGIELAYSF